MSPGLYFLVGGLEIYTPALPVIREHGSEESHNEVNAGNRGHELK